MKFLRSLYKFVLEKFVKLAVNLSVTLLEVLSFVSSSYAVIDVSYYIC